MDRPNRFIAHVQIEGKTETVHVKNTGRCRELLVPGCIVILEDCRGVATRKTGFDIIAVYKKTESGEILINMDSQAPNKVVLEWLGQQEVFGVKPEFTYGNSRIDFYFEKDSEGQTKKCLMEVKGCTLEFDGIGYFPDAPTERGVKHLKELAQAQQNGFECYIAFVVQIPGVTEVRPNLQTHAEFGKALEDAKKAGVQILCLCCDVQEDGLKIISPEKL